MSIYQVRVTRSTDQEYVDLHIRAETWDQAKYLAERHAALNERNLYPMPETPTFYVDSMDNEPEIVSEEEYTFN